MKSNVMLTLAVSALFSVQAYAQTAPTNGSTTQAGSRRDQLASTTPEQRAEQQTAQMKKQLSLTAEQETTVAAINLKYAQANQKLMTSGTRDRDAMRQAREGMETELKAVLSKEQFQQYETMREEQRNRMRESRGAGNNR